MTKFILMEKTEKDEARILWDVPEHEIDATTYEFSRLNPNIKNNISFWKKYVQEKGYYA